MKHIIWFILIILIEFQLSDGGCPKATFEFFNNTINAPYNFIDSSVGNIGSLETCPYTGRPYVYLPCYPNSSWGNEPYFSTCLKQPDKNTTPIISTSFSSDVNPFLTMPIEKVAELPIETSNDVSYVLSYLNQQTMTFKTPSDIASAVKIIDHVTLNNANSSNEIQSEFYSIANKLLSPSSMLQMQEAQKINRSIVKLISSVEKFSQNFISNKSDENFVENNLVVSIVNMPNNRTKPIVGFAFDPITNQTSSIGSNDMIKNSTSIMLDSQALSQQNRLTFSVYNHENRLFDEESYRVLTRVISLTIDKPELTKHLQKFVKINFYLENNFQHENKTITCAYWHIFNNMTAQWSTDGCQLISIKDRNVICECNHLTHFAILMDIEQKPMSEAMKQVLSIITLGGLFLSSIGLCLTILTFILF
ncbi:unnamed protein product, partial [Adineta steineri]